MFGFNGTERAIRELQTEITKRMDQSHRETSERMDRLHKDLSDAIGALEEEQAVTRTKLEPLLEARVDHEKRIRDLSSWRHRMAERVALGGTSLAALWLAAKEKLGL